MKRALLSLFVFAWLLTAQNPQTIADIAGDGAVHSVAASGTAQWCNICSLPSSSTTNCGSGASSGCVRTGGPLISTSRGQFITPGGCFFYPVGKPGGVLSDGLYSLAGIFYLAPVGTTVSVSYR